MARVIRSVYLNLLVLLIVSTNLRNHVDAQPVAPAPEPVAPAPEPVAPAPEPPAPEPVAPAPEPIAPAPGPVAPAPEPAALAPAPNSPPLPEARGGSSGLRGGQKAGIVIGVLVGAVLIGLCGLVCMKRQKNIRRNSYSNSARSVDL